MSGMEEDSSSGISPVGVIIFMVVGFGLLFYIYLSLFRRKSESDANGESKSTSKSSSKSQNKISATNKQAGNATKVLRKHIPKSTAKHVFSSPDLQCTFKGHTDLITSGTISSNGKGLVTTAEDRTLFSYNLKEAFSSGSASIVGSRTNISLDHVLKVCWSPDYTALVVLKADSLTLEVLKGTKKVDGTLTGLAPIREFPKPFTEELVGLKVAHNGKFIMTCDTKNHLNLWDLKGEPLAYVDTRHGNTLCAHLSLDDRFVVTTGFTPDAKVFEVEYDKSGNFKALKKIFELTGHNSRVFSVDSSADSSRMVTVSKDGTWRLFNTSVEYQQGQDPKFLMSGKVDSARSVSDEKSCVVRLSPDTRIVLVTVMSDVYCYSSATGRQLRQILNIYQTPILDVFFDAANQYFITLGGNHAHLFLNVAGYQETIEDLENSLKSASYSGLKERINAQLEVARSALAKLQEKQHSSDNKKKK